MNINEIHTDVLVIGAGPAGAVAASILHKKGHKVTVLEKQRFPRFVIGESLIPSCMEGLDEAGFIPALKAAEFQLKTGAIFTFEKEQCEFDFGTNFTDGWSWTWEVKRAEFDNILTDELSKNGVDVRFECTVTDVSIDDAGHSTTIFQNERGETETIHAKFIVDASGYGRVLPRLFNLDMESGAPIRTALFGHVQPKNPRTGDARNLIIIGSHHSNVWSWEIPFSDGTTSVGFVGERTLESVEGLETEAQFRTWMDTLSEGNERLTEAETLMDPKVIQGYSSASKQFFGKGYVLVGNSFGFVDPVFSSGVTIATTSGAKAANLVNDHLAGKQVDWQTDYTDFIQQGVDVFKAFVNYWYDGSLRKIFFTSEENPTLKKQICSILAGYVWDQENSLVRKYKRIPSLALILEQKKLRDQINN